MENNYKGNSFKSKNDTRQKLDKANIGAVKMQSEGKGKLSNIFNGSGVWDAVKNYVLLDVLIPTAKQMLYSIVTNGSYMMIYHTTNGGPRNGTAPKISYNNCYNSPNNYPVGRAPMGITGGNMATNYQRQVPGFDYENLGFSSRGDAEVILSMLENQIAQYGATSINDLYDVAGVTNTNSQSTKYGWCDLSRARVISNPDGYFYLDLPRALPLD